MTGDREATPPAVPAAGMVLGTLAFVGVGVALLAAGIAVQPRYRPAEVMPEAERVLFPQLTDASQATSLEVLSYDDQLATLARFRVAKEGGVWVLPDHANYPADAREQLAAAANELVDMKSLAVVSTARGDHETYGVIEPDERTIEVGMTGVGKLVRIGGAGTTLAELIIGKEDRRSRRQGEAGKTLRFVRKAGQDPVYRVEIDTSKFSTRFGDWIEKDLLQLSPWDVRRVTVDDSSCLLGIDQATGQPVVSRERRGLFELAYDDREAAWSPLRLEAFDKGNRPKPAPLGPGEELAVDRLNGLRDGLADLKIVSVARKPAGLGGDLRAEKNFTDDQQAVLSLAQRGFYPFDSSEILSSDGETVVGMKDGVEYVLRFGNGTSVAAADERPADGPPDATADDAEDGDVSGRYLLVMARFNEALLEKPTLAPLPEAPADAKADAPAAGTDEAEAAPADAAEELASADEAEAKAQAAIEERRAVERENRRLQDEYDAKVTAARKRVRDLNGRFADWYYVVSDAEYAKIHLGRADLVRPKAPDVPAE